MPSAQTNRHDSPHPVLGPSTPHTTVSAPLTSPAGDKHESPPPAASCSDVKGEGPQRDASASPALWAPFPVLCMYVIHVQQQGGAVTPGPQEHCSPDTSLHWDPTPCSSFLQGNSLLWSLGWAIAVTALSPGSSSDPHCTSESRWYHPHGEQEEAGPRVQECGHSPHLGRTILGGASGCLKPLPWIHVELIGQEDAGCPVSGGSEASMWCFCNTTQPGPRVVDPPPWSPDHGAVCRHLLCVSMWGEMGTGLSRHPGPESLLAGPVLEASSSSLGPEFAGFKLLLLVLTNALKFTELPS